jgi:transposase
MIPAEPDYQRLYEQSQQELARTREHLLIREQQLSHAEQKLQLALLEINDLRAKLFGSKSDQRVKKATSGQIDGLPLGATVADVATSEALLKEQVAGVEQGQQKVAEKRAKTATTRMVLPLHLEREEVILDPPGDLSNYQIIGEEVTEILILLPVSFKVKRIIRRKWALKTNHNLESKGVLIAPIPSRTVKRGLFDESLLAHLLISKYMNLPIMSI